MLRLPPLKALQAFRYAAQEQSFKLAAQHLHVTQAAVSQQIKSLEEYLERPLFKRLVREVVLTPEGERLLPYVSKAFAALEEGMTELGRDPQPNRLVLTTLPSFAARWLVPRLGRFQQQHADITIHLSSRLDLESFEGSELDLAIRYGGGEYPGLASKLLIDDYFLPVCHPSLINAQEPLAAQLMKLPLLEDDAADMAMAWPEFEKALGVTLRDKSTGLHLSDSTMLVEALLSGQGVGMLRFSLVYDLLERGLLTCPLPMHLKSPYSFYLVAPKAHFERPKVKLFERWLGEEIKCIEQSWTHFCAAQLGMHY